MLIAISLGVDIGWGNGPVALGGVFEIIAAQHVIVHLNTEQIKIQTPAAIEKGTIRLNHHEAARTGIGIF